MAARKARLKPRECWVLWRKQPSFALDATTSTMTDKEMEDTHQSPVCEWVKMREVRRPRKVRR